MKMKAARFYDHDGKGADWSVALYPANIDTERYPHEWKIWLDKREFNALGLRCPKKNEVILIDLKATKLGDGKP